MGSHVCAEKSTLGSIMAVQEIFSTMGCTGKMGGVLSNSDGGSDMEVQVGFVLMGCTGSGTKVGVPSIVSISDDLATNCLTNGVVEVSRILNSDGHPSFIDTVVRCSTTPVKRAEVSCHQPLLEQNHFSPISELVSDSFDENKLLLNWVNPTRSDKDEEDRQLLDYVPLAQWDPNGGLVLMIEEVDPVDISVDDDLEPLAWVSKKVKGFGK